MRAIILSLLFISSIVGMSNAMSNINGNNCTYCKPFNDACVKVGGTVSTKNPTRYQEPSVVYKYDCSCSVPAPTGPSNLTQIIPADC